MMYYRFFLNSFVFCVHLRKYDFSFAIEYCSFSHKAQIDKKTSTKYVSEVLIYFHEICLHVIF